MTCSNRGRNKLVGRTKMRKNENKNQENFTKEVTSEVAFKGICGVEKAERDRKLAMQGGHSKKGVQHVQR